MSPHATYDDLDPAPAPRAPALSPAARRPPRRRIDDPDSPLLWQLAVAAAVAIVALAAAGSLIV